MSKFFFGGKKGKQDEDHEFDDILNPTEQSGDQKKLKKKSIDIDDPQPIKPPKQSRKKSKQIRQEDDIDDDSGNPKSSSSSAISPDLENKSRQKKSSQISEDDADLAKSDQKKPTQKKSSQIAEDDPDLQKKSKGQQKSTQINEDDEGLQDKAEEASKKTGKGQSRFLESQETDENQSIQSLEARKKADQELVAGEKAPKKKSKFLQNQEDVTEQPSESKIAEETKVKKPKSQFIANAEDGAQEEDHDQVKSKEEQQPKEKKSQFLASNEDAEEDNANPQDSEKKVKSQFLDNEDHDQGKISLFSKKEEIQPEKKTKSKFLVSQEEEPISSVLQQQKTQEKPQKKKAQSKFQPQEQDQQENEVVENQPQKSKTKSSKFVAHNSDDEEVEEEEQQKQQPQQVMIIEPKKEQPQIVGNIFASVQNDDDDDVEDDVKKEQANEQDHELEKEQVEQAKSEEQQQAESKKTQQKKGQKNDDDDDLDEDSLLQKMIEENQKREEEEKKQLESKTVISQTEQTSNEEIQSADKEEDQETGEEKKLSKAQKKQLKEKQKQKEGGEVKAKEPLKDEKKGGKNKLAEMLRKKQQEEDRIVQEQRKAETKYITESLFQDIFDDALEKIMQTIRHKQKQEKQNINKDQVDIEAELRKKMLMEKLKINEGAGGLEETKKSSQLVQKSKQPKPVSGASNTAVEEQVIEIKEEEKVESNQQEKTEQNWDEIQEQNKTGVSHKEDSHNRQGGSDSKEDGNKDDKGQHLSSGGIKVTESKTPIQKKNQEANDSQQQQLRSPICCILGHVDTGQTTLLDKIRHTNVQEGEAGGITQQIGATFFPGDKLKFEVEKCSKFYPVDVNSPGLLIIDTPGHESFANLRKRGSSLADVAILVVDLMHGLENQTIQSMNLLKERKTPFIIALNKIDRTYEWKSTQMGSSRLSLQNQSQACKDDFERRYRGVITELNEQGINATCYWEDYDPKEYVPIVPTSGVTGEGIPDILAVIMKYTMIYMKKKMTIKENEFNCTVMEVKMIEGHGTTIDCILVDGLLRKNDTIVLLGQEGPIETKIRALLTPHPMKEMRVKGEYISYDEIPAAMGLKISAPGLDLAVAGCQLYQVTCQEQKDEAFELIEGELIEVKKRFPLQPQGVGVCASTLGSLEALLAFLNHQQIPVSYWSVGPVSKDDILQALQSVLADDPAKVKMEYACMLVFNLQVLPDAQKFADENGVKIFTGEIIYHLESMYLDYLKHIVEERQKEELKHAAWPCILKIVQIFRANQPIIMGVDIERGVLKVGTKIAVFNQDQLQIGVVQSIEKDKQSIKEARKQTGSVAIRLDSDCTAGRQFTETDQLVSIITRQSIDCLKTYFQDDVTQDEWMLIRDVLQRFFDII